MDRVVEIEGKLFLSYSYLVNSGISYNVVKKWASRKDTKTVKILNEAYIDFSVIPTPSKSKLPTEPELLTLLASDKKESQASNYLEILKRAQINNAPKHRAFYKDTFRLNSQDSLVAGMKHAVWEKIIELHTEALSPNGNLKKGVLELLFNAYKELYNGKYASKHAFIPMINRAKSIGIDTIVIDKRKFTAGNNRKFNELHEAFVNGVYSIGKAYSPEHIVKQITPMCNEANVKIPSAAWVKAYIINKAKHNENKTRYGSDKIKKSVPYASMQPALHANKQWQVDGFTIGFYSKTEGGEINKLITVVVKDAYSQKIIGYSIARSENRLSILDAYADAIKKTGGIAYEIVTDNHSFNRTKEGENFINEAKKIGVNWTITENPQYKSIIERGFKSLDQHFKPHQGYKGQGVKSREKNAHTSPEMLYEFLKADKILSEDEAKLIVISTIKEFNNTALKATKKSPEQMYNESEKPAWFELDVYEQTRLFINRAEYKISRGQINITIAGIKYEYQLSAAHYNQYNGKKVAVRYESLDMIYLFDLKTDNPICTVKQKPKIHGAKADQTPNDILLLQKNAGRIKGIKEQSRKEAESKVEKAVELFPNFFEVLHHHTTPKDVLKEAETNFEIRLEAERLGIDLSRVVTVPKTTEITNRFI